MSEKSTQHIPSEVIERRIYLIRGKKVMFDRDLARLYDVPTMRLNEQVKRNIKRFPEDFMFQLTKEEWNSLKLQFATSNKDQFLISQFAISKKGRGGRRKLPYVFTEQGVAMLSSVLHSDRAIEVNIQIMRTFTKLRKMMMTHKALAKKIENLEKKFAKHDKHFVVVFEAIRKLLEEPKTKKGKIGFHLK